MYYLGVEFAVETHSFVVFITLSSPLNLDQRNTLRDMIRTRFTEQFGIEDIPILIA